VMFWGMPGVTNTSHLSGMSRVLMSVIQYSGTAPVTGEIGGEA
jgi:hypothetical protein